MEYRHIQRPLHDLIIPNSILCNSHLDPTEKMILSEIIWLQDYNDKKVGSECTYCFASNYYFQRVFNISQKTVSKVIKQLCDKGYIKILKYQNGDFRHIRYNKNACLGS